MKPCSITGSDMIYVLLLLLTGDDKHCRKHLGGRPSFLESGLALLNFPKYNKSSYTTPIFLKAILPYHLNS